MGLSGFEIGLICAIVVAISLLACCCCCCGKKSGSSKGAQDVESGFARQRKIPIAPANVRTIDLHGLSVRNALMTVQRFLTNAKNGGWSGKANIITGWGKHSKNNQPKIKPKVETFLRNSGYKYSTPNRGMFSVDLWR